MNADPRPVIGITLECREAPDDARTMGELKLNWNYAAAIAEAGGIPLIVPPQADAEAVAPLLDGWLIPGGLDIDAARFGEVNHPLVQLQDPARFQSESALFDALPAEVPILGICYGCQFLNVKRGGSLEQHIPDRPGTALHEGGTLDEMAIEPDSRLGMILGPRAAGKSYHHQAVGRLGNGLRAVARHRDGTIEGIEAEDRPFLIGVQWHPERTLDDPASRSLFHEFVKAARAFRATRFQGATI